MAKNSIGIIGLGLIGGSLALALRDKYDVLGHDEDQSVREYARDNGFCRLALPEEMTSCKAVFVCVPVAVTGKVLEGLSALCGDMIISDVASVKAPFSGTAGRYVGGHPMAGVERGGIRSAKAHLFQNAYWIITAKGSDADEISDIVSHTGAKPFYMSADDHDRAAAAFSHVPHAAAYALVHSAVKGDLCPIAGTGFIDTTRIAMSDGAFWSEVFRLNRENVLEGLDSVIGELHSIRAHLERGEYDKLGEYMDAAKKRRTALGSAELGGEALYVDLVDRVGEFERVTGAIARAGINVTNIALVPGRDGVGGALRLEFATAFDRSEAKRALSAENVSTED